MEKHPEIRTSDRYYEKSREDKFKEWWDRMKVVMSDPEYHHLITNQSRKPSYMFGMFAGANPMFLHMAVFTNSVLQLGSEE